MKISKNDYVFLNTSVLRVILVGLTVIIYSNSLNCGFAFDDVSAIQDNRDLRPNSPISRIFTNDFWGIAITKEQSHKSYRPLCTLTFRLNYFIHQLQPFGYHLGNLILHVAVVLLYHFICLHFLPSTESFISSLLFAVHPIHTEAVTGVVGRAELLCSIFFLLSFFAYIKATINHNSTEWIWLLTCILLAAAATLSKEPGITVFGVCVAYEFLYNQEINIKSLRYLGNKNKEDVFNRFFESFYRILAITCATLLFIVIRINIMGFQLPVFTRFDNPAAEAPFPTRHLTYNYLLPVNAWLLLFPMDLCCDWTMGTIPLVESFLDHRNIYTLIFYATMLLFCTKSLIHSDRTTRNILMLSLSLIIFPFIPATNLFFPVGFVIAERVLYIPSMGFSMLVTYGFSLLYKKSSQFFKQILITSLLLLIVSHSIRTWMRNFDWNSEYTIFMAGLKVNQRNAKLYNNVGHTLESNRKYKEALEYFLKATSLQEDDIGAHINVGRTYNHLGNYELAEKYFLRAKNLLPHPKPGMTYQARVAPSHLNVFINLANLISRNKSRLEEADNLYTQAISMRADYVEAYINRGDILIKLNRTREAQEVYEKALSLDNNNPDIYYNLGVVFLEQSKISQALNYFNKALEIDPDHEQALINSAILMQEYGDDAQKDLSKERLMSLINSGKSNDGVYFNLGMIAMDKNELSEAEKWFRLSIEIRPDFRSSLFNLALLLSENNRSLEAIPILKQLLKYHPDHIKGLILLGDININILNDLDEAEKCYLRIIELDAKNVQGRHNLCVVYVEKGQLEKAEKCLSEVVKLAPQESYIQKNLHIVRAKMKKSKLSHG